MINPLMIKIIAIVVAMAAIAGSQYILHLPPNNPIQVQAEKLIKDEIDLEKSELLEDLL